MFTFYFIYFAVHIAAVAIYFHFALWTSGLDLKFSIIIFNVNSR